MLVPTNAPDTVVDGRMAGRRWLVALGAMTVVVWVIVVAVPGAGAASLVVRTRHGMAVLNPDGTPIAAAPFGQISPDGTVLVSTQARVDGAATTVTATSASTGEPLWSTEVDGDQRVRLVGHAGQRAVVAPRAESSGSVYRPRARTQSTFTVVGPDQTTSYSLWGNFEPEAFSLDGDSVFLIKYTPPLDPQSYQVRRFDLTTEDVVDVFTPDEELQQEMGGSARTQVASADGRRLYTLYTLQAADGSTETFVHVLSLDELWAHCIHLPHEFTGAPRSTALALSPRGDRLYVADGIAGRIAEIDTAGLSVRRDAISVTAPEGELMSAAVTHERQILIAAGTRLTMVDATTLQATGGYDATARITALQGVAPDHVLLGLDNTLVTVDLRSRGVVQTVTLPSRGVVRGFGTAPPPLPKERQAFQCAC